MSVVRKIEIEHNGTSYQYSSISNSWYVWQYWSEPMTSSGYDWVYCHVEKIPREVIELVNKMKDVYENC